MTPHRLGHDWVIDFKPGTPLPNGRVLTVHGGNRRLWRSKSLRPWTQASVGLRSHPWGPGSSLWTKRTRPFDHLFIIEARSILKNRYPLPRVESPVCFQSLHLGHPHVQFDDKPLLIQEMHLQSRPCCRQSSKAWQNKNKYIYKRCDLFTRHILHYHCTW